VLKRSEIYVACIALVFATGALAQSAIGTTMGMPAPVTKDRPFAAEIVRVFDQSFADGNHTHSEMHSNIFRDAEGRTRQETEVTAITDGSQRNIITIQDPIARVSIQLEPENKTATVYSDGPVDSGVQVTTPSASALKASPQAMAGPSANIDKRTRSLSGVGSGNSGAPTSEVEQLGTMVIEGITVTGTRQTNTTPAGLLGNSRPIVSSYERWFSSDLQLDLLTIMKHPQIGENTYKLINIRLGDPDPLLFQVPAGYAVKDNTQKP
jgi:hypothetical protein